MEEKKGKEFANMPGPRGFPLVGSAIQLLFFPERVLLKWGNEHYGKVFRYKMFRQDCVVLNGYEAVEEGLIGSKSKISGRITGPLMTAVRDDKGLFFRDYGEHWRNLKSLAVRAVGAVMGGLYAKINDQAEKFLSDELEYARVNDDTASLKDNIRYRMAQIVFISFLNKEFTHGDKELLEDLLSEIYAPFRSKKFPLLLFSPVLSYIPPFSSYLSEEKSRRERIVQKCIRWIEKHHNELDTRSKPGDIVKIFYEENPDPTQEELEELALLLVDMIFAGSATVTEQTSWVLLFLLKHPDMMEEAQRELDDAIEEDTMIADLYRNSEKVPFLRAVIQESLRMRPIAPGALQHRVVSEAVVAGFKIPKDVVIVPNLWSVHYDPEIWHPDPEVFRPDRHLDNDGKFKPSKHVIPFSIGERRCAGEEIARAEIFIFVATMLYRCDLCLAAESESVDMNGLPLKAILQTPEFNVILKSRKH